MPKKYKVTEEIRSLEGQGPLEVGEIYKITQNPKQTPRTDDYCIKVTHKDNFHLEDEDYHIGSIVKKEEFLDNTEEIGLV